jgi:hypothetical protein
MPATYDPNEQRLSDEGLSIYIQAVTGRAERRAASHHVGRYLVGVRVRPDRTDMDIRSIETSDPGQKPVLRTVG